MVGTGIILQTWMLCVIGFRASFATLQRTESVTQSDTRTKNDLRASASNYPNHRATYHYVSTPNVVTVAPLVLEAHPVPGQSTRFTVPQSEHSAAGTLAVAAQPYVTSPSSFTQVNSLTEAIQANPMLAAVLLSSLLGLPPPSAGYNTPEHQPPNPYVALLLSHYGRYVSRPGLTRHGIYGYTAANNIHNTRPFGSYKIYEDSS